MHERLQDASSVPQFHESVKYFLVPLIPSAGPKIGPGGPGSPLSP